MRGTEDAVYVVSIFFTFVIGISSLFLLYFQSRAHPDPREVIVTDYLGIDDEMIERIASGRLQVSLEFTGFVSGTSGIMVRNSGGAPLSGFSVFAGGEQLFPLAAPDILFPGSYGAILFDEASWEKLSAGAEIQTRQGARVIVRK